jgi:PspA-Associated protein
VIVRLLGEGQFRVDDALITRLNELDEEIAHAVESGDEQALWDGLQSLAQEVRANGSRLSDEELTPSDAVIPPEDLTLDEARDLLSGEGFIPDTLAT